MSSPESRNAEQIERYSIRPNVMSPLAEDGGAQGDPTGPWVYYDDHEKLCEAYGQAYGQLEEERDGAEAGLDVARDIARKQERERVREALEGLPRFDCEEEEGTDYYRTRIACMVEYDDGTNGDWLRRADALDTLEDSDG
jgi:hypothetical protein